MWARILKINSSGDIVWLSWPLGGDGSNSIAAVATDLNDNVLVSGTTTGESWRYPWIIKFAPSGEVLWWTIPDDAGDRDASGAAVDPAGNIVIVGRRLIKDSHGNWTPAGGWTGKYSPTGDLLWTRGMADQPAGVATDAAGNIVIHGNIAGRVDSDPSDAWVQKRDPDGNVLWKVRLHTRKEDTSAGVTVDFEGNVVVGGTTYGSLGAPNSGEADAWIAKLWP